MIYASAFASCMFLRFVMSSHETSEVSTQTLLCFLEKETVVMTRIDSERSGNAIGTVESPSNPSHGEHPVFTRTDHYLLRLAGKCDA
jgi:hypothetical protein